VKWQVRSLDKCLLRGAGEPGNKAGKSSLLVEKGWPTTTDEGIST
jgi:hypothetical protein